MPDYLNKAAIGSKKGSPYSNATLISDTSSIPTGSIFSLPYSKDSAFKKDTKNEQEEGEGGETFNFDGATDCNFEQTYMQQDPQALNLSEDVKGKHYCIVKEYSVQKINGKAVVAIMPYCKAISSIDIKKPGVDVKQSWKPEPAPKSHTIDLTAYDSNFVNTLTCSSYVIPTDATILFYGE